MLEKYVTFIKAHETLLLIVLFFGVAGFLGNKYINYESARADARNQAAQQTLQQQVSINNETQKKVDSLQQQYQTLLVSVQKQNATLIHAIASRNQAVAGQQHTDAGLSSPELAARHETLLGVQSGVSSTESGYLVSSPVELQTVQSLETIPVLQANLKDEQSLSANKDKQITGLNGVVTGLNGQVGGLQLQIADADKACTTKLDAVKKDARKSKRNWFIGGLLTGAGIVARLAF